MTKTIYTVLSVKQIRRMLSAAERSQRANKAKSSHCVVLDGLQLVEMPEAIQLTSHSVDCAITEIEDAALAKEQYNAAVEQRNSTLS